MSAYQPHEGWAPGGSQPQGSELAGRRLEGSGQQAGEAAGEVRQRARGLGYQLSRGAERARLLAAEGLSRAASSLRGSSSEADTTARRFAESLEQSATYLRERDLAGMRNDLVGLVRQYPAQALGAAFVAGLLIGQRSRRR